MSNIMSPNQNVINLSHWETDSSRNNVSAKEKGELLMALVDKVKDLDHVVIKSTSFINEDDELVVIPGPWAIVKPVESPDLTVEVEDDEDDLSITSATTSRSVSRNSSITGPLTGSPLNRFRSASTTVNKFVDNFLFPSTAPPSHSSRNSPPITARRTQSERNVGYRSRSPPKYVIRNEFGHARIQQYIVNPDRIGLHYHTLLQHSDGNPHHNHSEVNGPPVIQQADLFETGGHVVVSAAVFDECVEKGWGMRHPLAGHFHPITGTEIPPTTLLFRAPRNEFELSVVWDIVLRSYLYITKNTDQEVSAAVHQISNVTANSRVMAGGRSQKE